MYSTAIEGVHHPMANRKAVERTSCNRRGNEPGGENAARKIACNTSEKTSQIAYSTWVLQRRNPGTNRHDTCDVF